MSGGPNPGRFAVYSDPDKTGVEYRAKFSSPYPHGTGSLGPVRGTLEEALKDQPTRSEETHEYLSGVRTRKVEPWADVPLDTLAPFLKKE